MNPIPTHDCVFSSATTHQRGHTCWFDTAIVSLANTMSMRNLHTTDRKKFTLKPFKKRLSDEIVEHAGLSEFSQKLQKTISNALGDDICPLKPKEGQDVLTFLISLLDLVKINYISMKIPSIGNTPKLTIGDPEHTCERIGHIDTGIYIEEKLGSILSKQENRDSGGVLLVQSRGSDGTCLDIDVQEVMEIDTPYGVYNLNLSSMLVSANGHVMSFGKCRSSTEWIVYDNEFTGSGYAPRTFAADSFEKVKEQMYKFPHTFFDPKLGMIQMNPFFKEGIRSSTLFIYDFVVTET